MIELRSDTFTLPTQEMLSASATAPLGDDVWGEDPTVISLEKQAAELLGKEAAVLVSSGTQGNLTSILAHTKRGDEVICGDRTHIFNAESGSAAAFGGVQLHPVPNTARGTLNSERLRGAIRSLDIHYSPTTLICLENTHNACGGAVLDPDDLAEVRVIADQAGAKVHMDGARIFNAGVALGVSVAMLAEDADSVTFCLSKGLSAPVGSVVCGSQQFIDRVRKYRKMLGGGMRQAGIIAGPGIVAIHTCVERLAEDHQNARRIGVALAELPGVHVDLETLRTNIVVAEFKGTGRLGVDVVAGLARRGVLTAAVGTYTIRLVTHRGVNRADAEQAIDALRVELGKVEAPAPA
jgi:threonine aldolase